MPAGSVDPVAILLTIRNLRGFQAGMAEASASVSGLGKASATSTAAAARNSKKAAGALGLITKASKGLGFAAAATGFEAFRLSKDFEESMLRVHTQAGLPIKQLGKMKAAILDMSKTSQAGPDELSQGIFDLVSVGMKGPKALHSLRKAMDLAGMSGANLDSTTKAMAAAWMVNMPGLGRNMTHVIEQLSGVAGAGAMEMQDLIHVFGSGVLPVAKEAGVGFKDIGASLAILADEGLKGYSAGALLRTSFKYLTSPTDKARGALEELNLTSGDMVRKLQGKDGLPGTLEMLRDRLDKIKDPGRKADILNAIFPAGHGIPLRNLMNQVDRYPRKLRQMARISKETLPSIDKYHQTSAFRIHAAWSGLQASLIKVGDKIRKPLTDALVAVLGAARKLLDYLVTHKNEVIAFGKVIGVLAAAFVAYKGALVVAWAAQRLWAAGEFIMVFIRAARAVGLMTASMVALDAAEAANIFGVIVVAVAALTAGIIYAYHHSRKFRNIVDEIGVVLKWLAIHVFRLVKSYIIVMFVKPISLAIWVGKKLVGFLRGPMGGAFRWIARKAQTTAGLFKDAWASIGGPVKAVFSGIVSFIKDRINDAIRIVNKLIGAFNKLPGPNIGKIGLIGGDDTFQKTHGSGAVDSLISKPHQKPGIGGSGANLPGGFRPLKTSKGSGPRKTKSVSLNEGSLQIHSHVWIKNKEIGKAVGDYVGGKKARG